MKIADYTEPLKRDTFIELAGLEHMQDILLLTEEEIEDICTEAPAAAALLILDLIYCLYSAEKSVLTELPQKSGFKGVMQ